MISKNCICRICCRLVLEQSRRSISILYCMEIRLGIACCTLSSIPGPLAERKWGVSVYLGPASRYKGACVAIGEVRLKPLRVRVLVLDPSWPKMRLDKNRMNIALRRARIGTPFPISSCFTKFGISGLTNMRFVLAGHRPSGPSPSENGPLKMQFLHKHDKWTTGCRSALTNRSSGTASPSAELYR